MNIALSIVIYCFLVVLFYGDTPVLSEAVFSTGAMFFLVLVLITPILGTVVPLVGDRTVRVGFMSNTWAVIFLDLCILQSISHV